MEIKPKIHKYVIYGNYIYIYIYGNIVHVKIFYSSDVIELKIGYQSETSGRESHSEVYT